MTQSAGRIEPDCAAAGAPANLDQLCAAAKQHMLAGEVDRSIALLHSALKVEPRSIVVWDLLGACHARLGELELSVQAHENAFRFSPIPAQLPLYLNLANSMSVLGRPQLLEQAVRQGIAVYPDDPNLALRMAGILRSKLDLAAAQQVLEQALAANPWDGPMVLELGLVYERSSQLDRLDQLVAAIPTDRTGPEHNLLRAVRLNRLGRIDEVAALLPFSRSSRAVQHFERLSALVAEHEGRFGDAMGHFAAMNQSILDNAPERETEAFRAGVIANTRLMTQPPGPAIPFTGRLPAFVVGSPRSGTTLLDTLIGGHPDTVVTEERSFRERVEAEFPGLAQCTDAERIGAARARYFELVEQDVGPLGDRLLVDKHPMHLVAMPVIDRLFPGAPIVLAERHPCAAVLSCFITPLQPNPAMRGYSTLEGSAGSYDALFANWTRARECLPLNVHPVRYERMVENPAAELRPLMDFLGLDWTEAVLDSQSLAAGRGFVSSSSYSQILQPLHTRASDRWRKYRAQLEPVMPILRPWIDIMDYAT